MNQGSDIHPAIAQYTVTGAPGHTTHLGFVSNAVEVQQCLVWCWAAVVVMMQWASGPGLRQCDVVHRVLGGSPPCAGPVPSGFRYGYKLSVALHSMGLPATVEGLHGPLSTSLNVAGLISDLHSRGPQGAQVLLGVKKAAHAVAFGGVDLHPTKGVVIWVADPAEGVGWVEMFLSDAEKYADETHWTHLYRA